MRDLPALIVAGVSNVYLDADTLVLEPSGVGSEVRVERVVSQQGSAVIHVFRSSLGYTQSGRAVSLRYECPGECHNPTGLFADNMLFLGYTESRGPGGGWPREYERVAR